MFMILFALETHNIFGGIRKPFLKLKDQPSNQYFFILNLIHHAIHIVKTTCTTSTDDRPYHDLKWMLDYLWNTVRLTLFNFSVSNKWKFVCHYFAVKLVEETNLNIFTILKEHCEELKYVKYAAHKNEKLICSYFPSLHSNHVLQLKSVSVSWHSVAFLAFCGI